MNQAEASRRIERLEEDVIKIEIEMLKIQHLLVRLNDILHGKRDPREDPREERPQLMGLT
jgi:hypothetical protein